MLLDWWPNSVATIGHHAMLPVFGTPNYPIITFLGLEVESSCLPFTSNSWHVPSAPILCVIGLCIYMVARFSRHY